MDETLRLESADGSPKLTAVTAPYARMAVEVVEMELRHGRSRPTAEHQALLSSGPLSPDTGLKVLMQWLVEVAAELGRAWQQQHREDDPAAVLNQLRRRIDEQGGRRHARV